MTSATRLAKHSLWLLAARIGAQGLAVLFTILLARRMGSAGFGEYAFIAAVIFVGNGLTTFGTDMLLIREIAARDDLSGLPAALFLQLALSLAFIALVWAGAPVLPNQSPAARLALQIYSLALLPLAFYTVFTTALRGRQSMGAYTLLNLASSLLQVLAVWLLVQPGTGVVGLAVLLLVVQTAVALLAGILCSVQIEAFWQAWKFSTGKLRRLAGASAPLGVLNLLAMLYQKLGLALMSLLGGPVVTGWFSAAQRAVEAAKTGHLAVFTALYPAMAQAQAEPPGKTDLRAALRFSNRLLVAGAAVAALVLAWSAPSLLPLLFGPGFEPAIAVAQILAWILVPYSLNSYLTLAFLAAKREREVGLAATASLLGLAGLGLYWIPAGGAVGAAWACLLAEGLQAGVLLACALLTPALQKRGEIHELSRLS